MKSGRAKAKSLPPRCERHDYGHIANDHDNVWVWTQDEDGMVCGKTIPRRWMNGRDIPVPVDRVNADLDTARERGFFG